MSTKLRPDNVATSWPTVDLPAPAGPINTTGDIVTSLPERARCASETGVGWLASLLVGGIAVLHGNANGTNSDAEVVRVSTMVYRVCMARTNIDIDDELCQRVMDRFHLTTKRDAVNLALSRLAGEPLGLDEARSLRGSGWDGDLDEMRASRA